eukprot:CAMPEP_0178464560 /NCGR_PEP_ID=MMETSP0689_2-20121128/50904_1 /TAXON_ID=160604 /ORGANISM="Amphidinium massartii, Strain CS-259" /LENGTH=512 /DNA_ID=CAMNT_0020091463 /DNA_START=56 /DNA_END=1594 /DNA_ORIENTATION=+
MAALAFLGLVVGGLLVSLGYHLSEAGGMGRSPNTVPDDPARFLSHKAPLNVNLGGWFCLEDWFYSGDVGRYVSTPDSIGQGACLPPALSGPLDQPWPSEGVLTHRLLASHKASGTIDIFSQHRSTYITSSDLDDIASIGAEMLRLPITWAAFADALAPIDAATYGSHNPNTDVIIVPDPYYFNETSLVTVPRNGLAQLLRDIAGRGMKVLLDVHAFPAGSSQGTYNGIYPHDPVFWKENSRIGNTSVSFTEAGHLIVSSLIHWVEGLDASARQGVGGITVMNEPAHLLAGEVDPEKVLHWLAVSADIFRKSRLPARGVKLYMNVIETAFDDFDALVAPWWTETFTEAERNVWAVMDLHHYLAWTSECKGVVAETSLGGYKCSDAMSTIQSTLQSCLAPWAKHFAETYSGLRASTEFSIGTNQDAWDACADTEVTGAFLTHQLGALRTNHIEPFFWTWRMPYGPRFEAGWSFKRFAGLETEPASGSCKPVAAATQVETLGLTPDALGSQQVAV